MDPNDNESPYISIKGLLFAILKRTGIILIAGLVLGAVLFSYRFLKKTQSYSVLDTSVKLAGESDIQYEERVQNIDRARDIVFAISKVNIQIDNQRSYIANSLYMQIDASNQYESIIQVMITVDDPDSTGLETALIKAYDFDIRCGDYFDEYASQIGTKPNYIKELMTFTGVPSETSVTTSDNNVERAGSMYVWLYGPNREYVDDVTDLVVKEFNNKSVEFNNSIARHDISVVSIQRFSKSDNSTRDGQANQTSRLETLQKQIAAYNDSLNSIAKDLGVTDKEDIISYFSEENNKSGSVSNIGENGVMTRVKSGIKFGAIGFFAGIVFIIVCIVFKYVFGKTFTTQAQFFSEFTFIIKIGVLKPSGKRSKFATKIDIRSEDDSGMTAENTQKLISANYENITKDYKKILITGTGDAKAMSETVKSMGLKGDFKPDIFSDPDILKSVPDYDAVVLIEQRGVSLFKNVKNEINLITNGGAMIAGAIII